MSIHRAQRPDGWRELVERESEREREALRAATHPASQAAPKSARAQLGAVEQPLDLARWEDEGGPSDPCSTRTPVNDIVRNLVRQCLIPRVS
jgi:hypothetical protein